MTIGRVLRAVLIGVAGFWLLSQVPMLILRVNGIHPAQSPAAPDDPVYHDRSGRRINSANYAMMLGRDAAIARGIHTHAECREQLQNLQRLACDRYVTSLKNIPPYPHESDWDSGKTTAECIAEVDGYWRAVTDDLREMGDERAAAVKTRKHWIPERNVCDNFDGVRIVKVVYEPAQRLAAILSRLEAGGTATQEERDMVRHDIGAVAAFPDHPARTAYLRDADRFFALAR